MFFFFGGGGGRERFFEENKKINSHKCYGVIPFNVSNEFENAQKLQER